MSGHTVNVASSGFDVRVHATTAPHGGTMLLMSGGPGTFLFWMTAEDMRAVAHALTLAADEAMMPLPKVETLAHYADQATLAGDASHIASLIRKHPSYSCNELAVIINALGAHAAHMDRNVGLHRFDEVSALLDEAAGIAEDSYLPEHSV